MSELNHGTSTGWRYGCRCERCRLAQRETNRVWRQNKRRRELSADRSHVEGWPVEDVEGWPPAWKETHVDAICDGCSLHIIGSLLKNCPRCLCLM